jgi:hypothetical protein
MQTAQRHAESSEHRTDQFNVFHVQFKKGSALRTIRECACASVHRTVGVLQTFNCAQAINRCSLVAEINVTNGDYSDQTMDWVIRNSTAGMNPSSLDSTYRGSSPVLGKGQKWVELRPPKRAQGLYDLRCPRPLLVACWPSMGLGYRVVVTSTVLPPSSGWLNRFRGMLCQDKKPKRKPSTELYCASS